eukprot:3387105-Rhodomonas_salina.2
MFVSGWRCRRGAEKRVGKAGLAAVEGCGAAARGCRETKCCRRQVTWVLRWLHLRHKRESQKGIRDTKASEKEEENEGGGTGSGVADADNDDNSGGDNDDGDDAVCLSNATASVLPRSS